MSLCAVGKNRRRKKLWTTRRFTFIKGEGESSCLLYGGICRAGPPLVAPGFSINIKCFIRRTPNSSREPRENQGREGRMNANFILWISIESRYAVDFASILK